MPASSFTISKGQTLSGEGPGVEGISLAEILERVPSGVPVPHRPRPAGEVVVGVLAGLDRGEVPVAFDAVEAFRPLAASAIVDVSQADVGRRVVLAFNRGNLDQPIILGFLRSEEDGPAPIPRRKRRRPSNRLPLTARRSASMRNSEFNCFAERPTSC